MAMVACAVCGAPVPAGARFCPSCGSAVDVAAGAIEERRVVTVLFADLVGYTALAEHLDPENVKRLIESCFERLVADIEAFGGRVDKLLGDAVVALFGAPVAHEDDAERAVRAALRMQDTIGRFAADRDDAIQMRVGINTGEVLVGTLVGTDYTAMGDVVNTAARLQALAPPGGVLVGSATAALCSAAISREPYAVAEIRGRQQVEQPWLVTGATAAGSRPVRCDVPFVGRRAELALLRATVDLARAGRGGVVSIVGEAGAGKTRLGDEIVDPLVGEAIVLRTTCAPYGETNVWSPLVNGLASLFALEPDSTADDLRRAVEQRAPELWSLQPGDPELERYLGAVAYLFGQPSEFDRLDAAGARDRLAGMVADMMRRHAQTRMTVLWVDNLQWAEPMLRDLIAVVVRSLAELPFLLITSQRPDDDVAWPPRLDRPLVLRLPLGPLRRDEAEHLLRVIVERDDPGCCTDETVSELADRGGGNPLFLVELAAMAPTCRPGAELPGSLRALIAARLDQLPAAQRAIVDNAAVLGASGGVGALERFAREIGQDFRASDLTELVADGILELDAGWWRFRSDVVREVAYQTMTKRTRALRHLGVAEVLVTEKWHREEDLAHHFATAAELVAELGAVAGIPRSVGARATEALLAAATAAMAAGRSDQAIRHTSRALDLHVADGATQRRLLLVRSSAELDLRRFADGRTDAQQALDSALADGDRTAEGEARRRLGTIAHMDGDLATSRRELDAAIEAFRGSADRGRLAHALRARGFAEVFGGSLVDARTYLNDAMALYAAGDDERGRAQTHHNLAWVAFQAGEYDVAEAELAEACVRFEALGDRVGVNWALGLRAFVCYFQRRFEEAEELASSVAAEARRWGDTWAELMMETLIANLRLWTGRLAEAEQLADRALAGFRETNDRYGIMQALAPLTRARAGLGKVAEAWRGAEESISLGHSFGELGLALQGAAAVAVHLGDGEQALVLADQVLERHRTTGSDDDEAVVVRTLALCQLGRVDEALAAIEEISVADFPFGAAARALVRALAGHHDASRADAAFVETVPNASYFDIALARMAGVLAARAAGDETDHDQRLEQLSTLAAKVGDVTFIGVAQALGGSNGDPARGAATGLRPGWSGLIESALAVG